MGPAGGGGGGEGNGVTFPWPTRCLGVYTNYAGCIIIFYSAEKIFTTVSLSLLTKINNVKWFSTYTVLNIIIIVQLNLIHFRMALDLHVYMAGAIWV